MSDKTEYVAVLQRKRGSGIRKITSSSPGGLAEIIGHPPDGWKVVYTYAWVKASCSGTLLPTNPPMEGGMRKVF